MDFGLERALEARCWTANGGDNGYKQRIAQAPGLIDIHNAQDAEPHSACPVSDAACLGRPRWAHRLCGHSRQSLADTHSLITMRVSALARVSWTVLPVGRADLIRTAGGRRSSS